MRRIDWYIFVKLVQSTAFFTMVLVAVYWINRALRIFDELAAYGQKSIVYFELSALSVPEVLDMVLPIGCFAAVVTVTNRLSVDRELTIMQVNGFAPWRIARAYVALGALVTCLSLGLSNVIVPMSKEYFDQRSFEIRQNVTSKILRSGEFVHPAQDVTFFIERTREDGTLESVFLADQSERDQLVLYSASEAYFIVSEGRSQMIMTDGKVQIVKKGQESISVTAFEELSYDLTNALNKTDNLNLSLASLTSILLWNNPDEVKKLLRISQATLSEEIHARIAMPLLCISATMIGFAALMSGRFSRFGNWKQIVFAFFLLIAVKSVEGYVTPLVRKEAALWYLAYGPWVFASCVSIALLGYAAMARGPRRAKDRGRHAA